MCLIYFINAVSLYECTHIYYIYRLGIRIRFVPYKTEIYMKKFPHINHLRFFCMLHYIVLPPETHGSSPLDNLARKHTRFHTLIWQDAHTLEHTHKHIESEASFLGTKKKNHAPTHSIWIFMLCIRRRHLPSLFNSCAPGVKQQKKTPSAYTQFYTHRSYPGDAIIICNRIYYI